MFSFKLSKMRVLSILILLVLFGMGSYAQTGQNQVQQQQANAAVQNYGYCLTNVQMTAQQKAQVDKLQKEHQAKLDVLRQQLRSTRNWDVKDQVRSQMDALRAAHQEEIWSIVPEAKNYANFGRPGVPNGRGYYCRRVAGAGFYSGNAAGTAGNTTVNTTGAAGTAVPVYGVGYGRGFGKGAGRRGGGFGRRGGGRFYR